LNPRKKPLPILKEGRGYRKLSPEKGDFLLLTRSKEEKREQLPFLHAGEAGKRLKLFIPEGGGRRKGEKNREKKGIDFCYGRGTVPS